MPSSLIVFAHGAGDDSASPWMVRWSAALRTLATVHTFDYPRICKAEQQAAFHAGQIETAAKAHPCLPIVLAGKSYGSRVGMHAYLELPPDVQRRVAGFICFGYPLVGGGKKEPLRDAIVSRMGASAMPVFFAVGTRDTMSPIDTLRDVLKKAALPPTSVIKEIYTGDHSLTILKRPPADDARAKALPWPSQAEIDADLLASIRRYVGSITGAMSGTALPKAAASATSAATAARTSGSKSKRKSSSAPTSSSMTSNDKSAASKKRGKSAAAASSIATQPSKKKRTT